MFLPSFMRKKDQFMQWMMTPEFQASRHFNSEQGRYAYANFTNLDWWANMQYVLKDVESLYVFLRFADQDQVPTLGEVVVQYQNTKQTYAANLSQKNPTRFQHIMEIIDRRISTVMLGTYVKVLVL
jgi:DNA modification methylase